LDDPPFGTRVKKEGRQTAVTQGAVRIKSLSILVDYPNGAVALFEEQLGIIGTSQSGEFAEQGDSGALIVDEDSHAIGLLFSKAEGIDLAYANPIKAVLDELGVRLV